MKGDILCSCLVDAEVFGVSFALQWTFSKQHRVLTPFCNFAMQVLQILHILQLRGAVLGLALMAGLVLKPGGDLVLEGEKLKSDLSLKLQSRYENRSSALSCKSNSKLSDHLSSIADISLYPHLFPAFVRTFQNLKTNNSYSLSFLRWVAIFKDDQKRQGVPPPCQMIAGIQGLDVNRCSQLRKLNLSEICSRFQHLYLLLSSPQHLLLQLYPFSANFKLDLSVEQSCK